MELKPSHEIFANELIVSNGNKTLAYSKAYPKASYKSCRSGGWYLSRNVQIQGRLQELLTLNGLSLANCISKLNVLTHAEKFHHYGKNGVAVYQPDNYVRLQAVQTALKIHVMLGNVDYVKEDE